MFLKRKKVIIPEETINAPSYVYRDYETFLLSQPHIKVTGLYKSGDWYLIVCPELTDQTASIEGQPINNWFRDYKTLGSNTRLSKNVPPNSKKVRIIVQKDEANLASSARNLTFLYNDLLSNLPHNFPSFRLPSENTGTLIVHTESPLSDENLQILHDCLASLNESHLRIEFRIGEIASVKQNFLEEPIFLKPSRSIANKLSPEIKRIQEYDEDFWQSNKVKLLDQSIKKEDLLEKSWLQPNSSCVVSDYLRPDNLRNHLTLYNTIYLRMPILSNHQEYFSHLGCTEKELTNLCHLGRVRLLLDQSLERYHPNTLDILCDIESSSYVQSRQLAVLNVADLRKRIPFAFPILDIETKYELLHEFYRLMTKNKTDKAHIASVIQFLSAMWGNFFEGVERSGVYGLAQYGTYHFTNFIFEKANKDLGVEIMDTEPGVNYAACLGANLITRKMINDEALAKVIANIYSGVPKNFIPGKQYEANTTLNDILLVNSDVPILELANTFKSSDIDRFRSIVYCLTKHSKNDEELLDSINSFNNEVKHFVTKNDRLGKLDLAGFLVDGGMSATGVSVPFIGWFTGIAVKSLIQLGARKKTVSIVHDYLNAQLTGTIPEAVLVARMRDDLQNTIAKSKYGY